MRKFIESDMPTHFMGLCIEALKNILLANKENHSLSKNKAMSVLFEEPKEQDLKIY